jgi:hypothetical protein
MPTIEGTTMNDNSWLLVAAEKTRHAYTLEVRSLPSGAIRNIEVHANSRAQARKCAEKAGYEVRSVNMTG